MRQFLYQLFVFSIPVFLFVAVYLVLDPFMVIHDYDNYYAEQRIPVSLDRDYVSTQTYLNQREQYKYDSFIFGNSRSLVYHVADWKRHLQSDASCFHFDASSETLYGISCKMHLIDRNGDKMKAVLLVLDTDLLATEMPDRSSHLFYPAPILENYRHGIGFQWAHFKACCNPKLAFAIADYMVRGQVKDYMTNSHLLKEFHVVYDLPLNELRYDSLEHLIAVGEYYTPRQMQYFDGKQHPGIHEQVIGEHQQKMLREIRMLLQKQDTDYKVLISPLYSQQQLHPHDKQILDSIFGAASVYDFSGVSRITGDYHNYYEDSHYRPHVAQYLMEQIYSR